MGTGFWEGGLWMPKVSLLQNSNLILFLDNINDLIVGLKK